MCAQSGRQTFKRNTPENSEHADILCRQICHVARNTAAAVKGFQELPVDMQNEWTQRSRWRNNGTRNGKTNRKKKPRGNERC